MKVLVRYSTATPGALSGMGNTFFPVLVNGYIHMRYTMGKRQCSKWHTKSSRDNVH